MSISTEITRLQTAKADIKTAIENKGVTVPSDAKLDTYDDYVAQISTGIVPSGNIELQQQTGTNVTNYATASVKTGSATVTGSAQQSAPTFSRSGTTVTASVAARTIKAIPLVSAGWVDSGTEGTVTMSANSATYTIPTQAKTATANGTVSPDSGYLLSSVSVSLPTYSDLS